MSKVTAIEIPLIISIIALQLPQPDLWSCVQVSHAWHASFLPFLWRSINLTKRKRFRSLDHDTIRRHGTHVRHLEGIDSRNIAAVQVNSIRLLKSLVITLTTDARFNANCFDLMRRNMHCLQSLVLSRATQPGAIVAVLPFASLILPDIFIPMPSFRRDLQQQQQQQSSTKPSSSSSSSGTTTSTTTSGHLAESIPLSRGSALVSVTLKYVDMTRDGFSIFLQVCPALEELSLERFEIIEEAHDDYFQHSRIKHLTASLDQIWYPSSSTSSSSSSSSLFSSSSLSSPTSPGSGPSHIPLLIHFPQLSTWHFLHGQIKRTDLSIGPAVVEVISRLCPRLVHVHFGDLVSESVFMLLLGWFKHLQRVTLHYTSFVGGGGGGGGGNGHVLSALLVHQDTLREIVLLDKTGKPFEVESPPPVVSSTSSSSTSTTTVMEGKIIQLLFRSCRQLERVSMPMVELDVAHMEEYPWGCTNLRELHVRFRGVSNSAEDVQMTLFALESIASGKKMREIVKQVSALALRGGNNDSEGSSAEEKGVTTEVDKEEEEEKGFVAGDLTKGLSTTVHGRLALQLHKMKNLESLWIGSKMLRRRKGRMMDKFVELN